MSHTLRCFAKPAQSIKFLKPVTNTHFDISRALFNSKRWRCWNHLYFVNNLSSTSFNLNVPGRQTLPITSIHTTLHRNFVTSSDETNQEKKPGIFKRFKQMYKDYWYILVPVHVVTSAMWFTGFYYLVSSGVDVVVLMENIGVSEKLLSPLRNSSAGYLAVAYAFYKIATPLRYAITIGGTTISINILKAQGYIKPMPSKEKLKEMIQEKKDNLQVAYQERKEEFRQQTDLIKEKKSQVMKDLKRYKQDMQRKQNDVKTK